MQITAWVQKAEKHIIPHDPHDKFACAHFTGIEFEAAQRHHWTCPRTQMWKATEASVEAVTIFK